MSKDHLQKRTTSSEDEPSSEAISGPQCTTSTSRKMAASIALQIVDSDQEKDQDNTTSLTLAQEIASFEFIDEKTSSTSSPISSLASDFDVWSPRDKGKIYSKAKLSLVTSTTFENSRQKLDTKLLEIGTFQAFQIKNDRFSTFSNGQNLIC